MLEHFGTFSTTELIINKVLYVYLNLKVMITTCIIGRLMEYNKNKTFFLILYNSWVQYYKIIFF